MADRIGSEGVHLTDAAGPEGMRLYAIGDVHGRLDLLEEMHTRIRSEIERDGAADWRIVHVGDYIDRGPDSRGVIEFLIEAIKTDQRHIALCGNHDAGLVDFLTSADPNGLFGQHGGRQTAMSYGVDADFGSDAGALRTAGALRSAMPGAHLEFLATLPRSIAFGDFFFCHAGIRPGVPLERQDPEDLIWIRQAFLNSPLLHEKVVVHGHTPSSEPQLMPNRVNVDTGAYFSGTLTALSIEGSVKRLLQVVG